MRTRIVFCSAVLTMLSLLSIGMAHAESTYIIAGSLIDPLKGKVIRDPVVEIQGDRIVAVTSGGALPDRYSFRDQGRRRFDRAHEPDR